MEKYLVKTALINVELKRYNGKLIDILVEKHLSIQNNKQFENHSLYVCPCVYVIHKLLLTTSNFNSVLKFNGNLFLCLQFFWSWGRTFFMFSVILTFVTKWKPDATILDSVIRLHCPLDQMSFFSFLHLVKAFCSTAEFYWK